MNKINIYRVIIGGLIAGIICFVGDGIVHGALLSERWAEIMNALGKSGADVGRQHPGYFLSYDILKGILAVGTYAAIRPRFGPGAATAVIASLGVWMLVIPVPLLGLLPMQFFGRRFVALWSLYGLVPILVGTLVGAWFYREEPEAA